MVVILPRARDGLSKLEEQITPENLAAWLAALRSAEVRVTLPKFKLTSQFHMARVLSAMGMRTAFTHKADFSGITTAGDIFIDDVIHKAYVDVHEEGTEAAAATGITMTLTSARPDKVVDFKADHPFVFLIRDNRTGSILFMGRVADPRG
jgi:serpin B